MQCFKCGVENSDNGNFCTNCGSKLHDQCPKCGFTNQKKASYCSECGNSLDAGSSNFSEPLTLPRPDIPPRLVKKAVVNWQTVSDELKQVTVFFADICNSTALIEDLGPEEALARLEPTLNTIVDAIHDNDGIVSKLQGDGLMAVFGAPIALEDHAARACFAAEAVREGIIKNTNDDIQIRIGINTGEVLVRSVGVDLSMEFEAIGPTVHLAARMEQLAGPGQIYITHNTFQQVEGFVKVHPLGKLTVKGVSKKVESYLLEERNFANTRWGARLAKGLTAFIGRAQEMVILEEVQAKVDQGFGQGLTISGEPGIGKSRLLYEFLKSDKTRNWVVIETSSDANSQNLPYFLISNLFRSLFGCDNEDSPQSIIRKVDHQLTIWGKNSKNICQAVHTILGLPPESKDWTDLDPFQRRHEIIDACEQLFHVATRDQPIILAVEDLQWVDRESQAILQKLANRIDETRLLLIVTFRDEYDGGWTSLVHLTHIELSPLTPEQSNLLLGTLLGQNVDLVPLKRKLVDLTEGTPLFLEEMAKILVETGTIDHLGESHLLASGASDLTLPASVQSVIAARIDCLDHDLKALLQMAAVIGKELPVSILEEISGLDAETLRSQLFQLQSAGFLYHVSMTVGSELLFKHDLTRLVAYESNLHEHRRKLHAQVTKAIEKQFSNRTNEFLGALAYHSLHGGLWETAIGYHIHACENAISNSANNDALAIFEDGLRALDQVEFNAHNTKAAIDLRLIVINALIALGDLNRIIDLLIEAERFSTNIDDQRRLASVNTQLAVAHWLKGNPQKALTASKLALQVGEEIDHPVLQIAARFSAGMAFHAIGNYRKSVLWHQGLLKYFSGKARFQRAGWPAYPTVFLHTFLASASIELGDFEKAGQYIQEGCKFADLVNHPYSQATIQDFHGYYLLCQGQNEEAAQTLEKSLEICRKYEILNLHRSIGAKLAMAYTRAGRSHDAKKLLEPVTATEDFLKGGTYIWISLFMSLAEIDLVEHRFKQALDTADRGFSLAVRSEQIPHQAYCLKLRADILHAMGEDNFANAEENFRNARKLASKCEMAPLVAHCDFAKGKLLRSMGRDSEAVQDLKNAGQSFEKMHLTILTNQVNSVLKHIE